MNLRPLTLLAAALLISSCSNTTPAGAGSPAPAAGSGAVTVEGFKFIPEELKVKAGDSVTWTFKDTMAHTATNDSGSAETFDSGLKKSGETYSYTFKNKGTFNYHCTPHATTMKAKIVVE